jgi:hypothetical protein
MKIKFLQRRARGAALVVGLLALAGATACEPVPQSPIGNIDGIAQRYSPDYLDNDVTGWAWDPDTSAPIAVHVYVDGGLRAAGPASESRPDVAAAYPGAGPDHGFRLAMGRLDVGPHTACVYAINAGPPADNALLGCVDATVPAGLPWGYLDAPTGTPPGPVSLTGIAMDPDTTGPIDVHLYVDGQATQARRADINRPELAGAFPPYGEDHGYRFDVDLPAGPHELCVYPINVGPGFNLMLGCRTV